MFAIIASSNRLGVFTSLKKKKKYSSAAVVGFTYLLKYGRYSFIALIEKYEGHIEWFLYFGDTKDLFVYYRYMLYMHCMSLTLSKTLYTKYDMIVHKTQTNNFRILVYKK